MHTVNTSDVVGKLLLSLKLEGQPAAFYAALENVLHETTGFIFVTLFLIHEGQTLRVFTTNETHYPVGARKPMASTPWGDLVIRQKKSFIATDRHAIRAAYFDHATIESLGCGSAISVPIVYSGNCLGALNLNHREGHYDEKHVSVVEAIAPLLVPILLDTLRQLDAHG